MCEDEKPPCRNITTLHTYKTDYNADSVEWCPHPPHQNVFVCANYQLEESNGPRKRVGCILLFSVTKDALRLHHTVATAAVLDQKWCHEQIDSLSLLAVANADRTLEIYKLNSELMQLELVASCAVETTGETLLLSLDWSTGKCVSKEVEAQIVCSDSQGRIHRFRLRNTELVKEGTWEGHEFEAWITCFYYWDPNVFFSGGDDCVFLQFDKRTGAKPVARNRSHEAGVTAMHSNLSREFILATGSYDTQVRLWDIRSLKTSTSSIKTPGTLWRLKWDPFAQKHLLAACMLGGIHILNSQPLEIVDSYYKHESIAYGSDWSFTPKDSTGRILLGTCSFYDNLLCVSEGILSI